MPLCASGDGLVSRSAALPPVWFPGTVYRAGLVGASVFRRLCGTRGRGSGGGDAAGGAILACPNPQFSGRPAALGAVGPGSAGAPLSPTNGRGMDQQMLWCFQRRHLSDSGWCRGYLGNQLGLPSVAVEGARVVFVVSGG